MNNLEKVQDRSLKLSIELEDMKRWLELGNEWSNIGLLGKDTHDELEHMESKCKQSEWQQKVSALWFWLVLM